MNNENTQNKEPVDKLSKAARRLSDIANIAKSILAIAVVAATFYGAVIYAKIYIFKIKQYPEFSLHDLLSLGLLSFAWAGVLIAAFYAFSEVIFLNVRQLKENLKKKKCVFAMADIGMTVVLLFLQVLPCTMLISLFFGLHIGWAAGISIVASLVLSFMAYVVDDNRLNLLRLYVLCLIAVIYFESDFNSLESAHIANFQADVATKMSDSLELELAKYDIYELPECTASKGASTGLDVAEICIAKRGLVKITNARVKANFGKYVFVDLKQKDGEAMSLKLLAEHTRLRINK